MANKAKMNHLLNLKFQDIQDKKQERNTMRIGVNEEIKQDINKAQLNLTKPWQEEEGGPGQETDEPVSG